MRADPLRVTVLRGGRRTDVAVPVGLPVAELLPLLVAAGGGPPVPGAQTPDAACHLTLPGGRPLDPEAALEDQGVPAGAVLVLAPVTPPPPCSDDPAEALGAEVARTASWEGRHRDVAHRTVAVGLVLLAAVGVVRPRDPTAGVAPTAVAAVGVLALLALAARASRTTRGAPPATPASSALSPVLPTPVLPTPVLPTPVLPTPVLAVLLACVLAAAGAAAATAAVLPGRAWLPGAGPLVGAAVLLTAAAGSVVLTRRRGLLLAAALPGSTLVVLGLLARGPVAPAALVAGSVVVLVLLGGLAPAAALAVVGRGGDPLADPWTGARETGPPGGPDQHPPPAGHHADHADHGVGADQVSRASDLVAGAAGGVGLLLVAAAPLLAVTGRAAAVLGGVLALHLVLRARRSHGLLLVVADLGSGVLAAAGVAGVLLATDAAAREVLVPGLVLAGPLLLLGPATSVGARRVGDVVETATAVALLPLLAVVTGLLDLVGG